MSKRSSREFRSRRFELFMRPAIMVATFLILWYLPIPLWFKIVFFAFLIVAIKRILRVLTRLLYKASDVAIETVASKIEVSSQSVNSVNTPVTVDEPTDKDLIEESKQFVD